MLAIDGGKPLRETPFPPRALFGAAERDAALRLFDRAIESGSPIGYGGPEEQAYEAEFAAAHGGGFADLVNSGTSALYAALGGLELEPASEVVVPPISDPGGVMPVALLNLVPVVADAAPGSFNAGPEQIEAVLSPRTRAIVVAHIAGEPAELDAILELSRDRGLPLIEDCAQAHGARFGGRMAGTLGTLGVFSTMSGKHHATGPQGGVVFTTDEDSAGAASASPTAASPSAWKAAPTCAPASTSTATTWPRRWGGCNWGGCRRSSPDGAGGAGGRRRPGVDPGRRLRPGAPGRRGRVLVPACPCR